jgi:multidrug efflux pump subunit AcrA (membrane-fusion protein)
MVVGKRSLSRGGGRGRNLAPAVALALVGMILACGDRNVYQPPPPPKVTVSQPLKKPVTDYLEFTGNAVAYQTVQLRARVEGFLEKLLFYDGETVKKGKLLFSSNRSNTRPNSRRRRPRCCPKRPNWSTPRPNLSATPGW